MSPRWSPIYEKQLQKARILCRFGGDAQTSTSMRNLFVALILLLAFACTREKQGVSSKRAFYYWQTSLRDFPRDSTYDAMKVDKLYMRVFDVDWSEESHRPIPVSPLNYYVQHRIEDSAELVPVVFITNETFKNLDRDQSVALARQVHEKVMRAAARIFMTAPYHPSGFYENEYWQQNPYQVGSRKFDEQHQRDSIFDISMKRLHEVQFDCDWTKSTKDRYFAFLEESVKLFAGRLVSSTIRLYQYKYPKDAGLPPVKRGMLMCYNAGDIKDPKSLNSIFDKKEVMSYLNAADYPIPLDYALPMFGWALLYRDRQLKAILPMSTLSDYSDYLEVIDKAHVRVTRDFVNGYTASSILLRAGDEIRLEKTDMEQVNDVVRWLSAHKNNPEALLTFYHLNEYDFQEHSKAIESIFNSF
jgi:hypothetical protein